VAEFVDGASEGVVLVAFGTTPQSSFTMNLTDFSELCAVRGVLDHCIFKPHFGVFAAAAHVVPDMAIIQPSATHQPLVDRAPTFCNKQRKSDQK
jgi:hypothetical protein